MPIYKYCCDECKYYTEKILAMSQCDVTQTCDHCDGDLKKMITMPAKTASLWGVDWRSGLGSNMYSKSLGAHVTSKREEEDRMRITDRRWLIQKKNRQRLMTLIQQI